MFVGVGVAAVRIDAIDAVDAVVGVAVAVAAAVVVADGVGDGNDFRRLKTLSFGTVHKNRRSAGVAPRLTIVIVPFLLTIERCVSLAE